MKKLLLLWISLIACFPLSLEASPLDGLWTNDRHRITLRIESDEDGLRVKRTDQGVWFRYEARSNNYFEDRKGNAYELVRQDELVWHDVSSTKRIHFIKVRDSGHHPAIHDNFREYDWHDDYDYQKGHSSSLINVEGTWADRLSGRKASVKSLRNGLLVKIGNHPAEKYFADRSGVKFRNKFGHTIHILDHQTFRWRDFHSGRSAVFTRMDRWNSRW